MAGLWGEAAQRGLERGRLHDGQLGFERFQQPPPSTRFWGYSDDAPRIGEAREQHGGCGFDKLGRRIFGELRDGHSLPAVWRGRGGRIPTHEKRGEGRGGHEGFGFGACGTAAAPRLGKAGHARRVAGWISGGGPPDQRGAKRPEERAWRSLCSHAPSIPRPQTKNPLWMRKTPLTLRPSRRRMIS